MRKFFLMVIISILVFVLVARQSLNPTVEGDLGDFTRTLDVLVPELMERYEIPGASIALALDSQVVWAKGYGLSDKASGKPMTSDSVFQASSISKSVTAWGVLKLVEAGKIELDAPIEKYFNDWHLPQSEFDNNAVTIRRLLSHNAGLNVTKYSGNLPDEPLPTLLESLREWDETGIGIHLIRQPGSKFNYSDTNFILLQLALEEYTDEPFPDYMQREVLAPLGMDDSSYYWTDSLRSRTAVGYNALGEAWPTFRFSELSAAGLYTTAPQLTHYLTAFMVGSNGEPVGRGVLTPATVATMTSPLVEITGSDRMIYSQAYGWGLFIETLSTGELAISHMGGNEGYRSDIAAIPEKRASIAVLTNSDLGHELFADVLTTWTTWLDCGPLMVAETIQTARRFLLGISAMLVVWSLALAGWIAMGWKSDGRRFFLLAGRPLAWKRAAVCIILLVGLAVYWAFGDPVMQADMPSVINWLSFGVTLLILAVFALLALPSARNSQVTLRKTDDAVQSEVTSVN